MSKCKDYFDIVGIEDGVVSPFCEEAESCSCGDHDIEFVPDKRKNYKTTVGLYNECKCNFWSKLCADEEIEAGEACDYAAEYCCGDYRDKEIDDDDYYNDDDDDDGYSSIVLNYPNNATCFCDFFMYAENELGYVLKSKALNVNKELKNPCKGVDLSASDSDSSGDGDERTSLEAMYNETNGSKWKKDDGWMNETVDHCHWYGISCGVDGRITSIDLRDNNLAGRFPIYRNGYQLSGEERGYTDTNYGLANLYKLQFVDLADNKLTGMIDYAPLYNLPSLKHFDVSGNQLSGEINALVTPVLTYANFRGNNFTSMRRFDEYKGSYQTLRFCDVSSNAIQINATDSLKNFPPHIEQLFASNNYIYGSLPKSMNNLPKLRRFNMSYNALTGSLPESMNNLPQLRQFDISSNALSGPLPGFAESILTLQELHMSNQTIGFTGSIPEDMWRFQSLKVLNLAGNKLEGTIPASIGNMAVLELFDLSNNLLKSSIPPELGMLEGEYHCLLHLHLASVL